MRIRSLLIVIAVVFVAVVTISQTAPRPFAPPAKPGPKISGVRHVPAMPTAQDSFTVTASVAVNVSNVTEVVLHYRVMFGRETAVPMVDDGAHGDGAAGDGVYGAVAKLAGAKPGEMIRYRITASDASGGKTTLPAYLDPTKSEQYFGTVTSNSFPNSRLPVVQLFVVSADDAENRSGSRGDLFYLGEFYDNITVRLHGQITTGLPKKSYNVEFPHDHHLFVQTNYARTKEIKLLTDWGDKSRLRNTVSYELIRAAGSIGHYAFPVRVEQNGRFHGLMDLVENGDEKFLKRVGLDPNGALYKINSPLYSTNSDEKKTRKQEGMADLQTFIANLKETRPMATRVTYAYENINLPQTISYFVGRALISDRDHGHKNYYLYHDNDGTGEWAILPWDVDLSLGHQFTRQSGFENDQIYTQSNLSFYNDPWAEPRSPNSLYDLIFEYPEFRAMYLRRMRTVMDAVLQPPGLPAKNLFIESRIFYWLNLVDPPGISNSDAALDYAKWGSWGNQNKPRFEAQQIIDVYLAGRRDYLFNKAALEGDRIPSSQAANPVVTVGPLDSGAIPLINTEKYAVDISGWSLVGGAKFVFKPGTVIPAGRTLFVCRDVVAFRRQNLGKGLFVQGNYEGNPDAETAITLKR